MIPVELRKKSFVMVVCGGAEHIQTLQFSLPYLRSRTQYPVTIVTDNSRNEIKIDDPCLIDIKTPKEMDHHQASIYLKTSLHKILPKEHIYVYLDTDILPYGKHTDEIFDQYLPPIRFAADHCLMPQFSAHAVRCECLNTYEHYRNITNKILRESDPLFDMSPQDEKSIRIYNDRKKLFTRFETIRNRSLIARTMYFFRFMVSWPVFRLSEQFSFDRRKKVWLNKENIPVMYQINNRDIAQKAGIKWNMFTQTLQLPDGRNLWKDHCHHLAESIEKKFSVKIKNQNWQHWNGGVFIFSDESSDFMDTWHNYTMQIFKDEGWRTRDQGTLIATVWKHELQHHPVLDKKWNLILDYYNSKLEIDSNRTITVDGQHYITPEFVHIYHHWNDIHWEVWNSVIEHMNEPENSYT